MIPFAYPCGCGAAETPSVGLFWWWRVSLMRARTTTPETKVSVAMLAIAHGTPMRSASSPAS